jgi:hypothetical protein
MVGDHLHWTPPRVRILKTPLPLVTWYLHYSKPRRLGLPLLKRLLPSHPLHLTPKSLSAPTHTTASFLLPQRTKSVTQHAPRFGSDLHPGHSSENGTHRTLWNRPKHLRILPVCISRLPPIIASIDLLLQPIDTRVLGKHLLRPDALDREIDLVRPNIPARALGLI